MYLASLHSLEWSRCPRNDLFHMTHAHICHIHFQNCSHINDKQFWTSLSYPISWVCEPSPPAAEHPPEFTIDWPLCVLREPIVQQLKMSKPTFMKGGATSDLSAGSNGNRMVMSWTFTKEEDKKKACQYFQTVRESTGADDKSSN